MMRRSGVADALGHGHGALAHLDGAHRVADLPVRGAQERQRARQTRVVLDRGGERLGLAQQRDDPGVLAQRHEHARQLVAEVDGERPLREIVRKWPSASSA